MKHINTVLLCGVCLLFTGAAAQETYSLQSCLNLALQTNHTLKKARLDVQKAGLSKKEVMGGLLPQVSGNASLTDNLKKTRFIMPNFMKEFLPSYMLGSNTADYMEIEMGMTYQTGAGIALSQQLLNLSLLNAVKLAETAGQLAKLGNESKEEDVIAQTAALYYAIQVTGYTVSQLDSSLALMNKLLETMTVSFENGMVRKVELDRLQVARTNLETQKRLIMTVLEVQKNTLKLQMGKTMLDPVEVSAVDLDFFEKQSAQTTSSTLVMDKLTPYQLMMRQKTIGLLQKKSALYESMPVVALTMNYNYNYMGNQFLKSDFSYPNAIASISLKVPVFGGFSRASKLKQAQFEQQKIDEDASSLEESLNMAFINANLKLEDSRRSIALQKENRKLAMEVFNVTETNYRQGLASMSDVLNASSSLIQSQINYANALSDYMKAYIDLKKSNGTIRDLVAGN